MDQEEPPRCSHGVSAPWWCRRPCRCGHACMKHGAEGCEGAGRMEEVCYCARFEEPEVYGPR